MRDTPIAPSAGIRFPRGPAWNLIAPRMPTPRPPVRCRASAAPLFFAALAAAFAAGLPAQATRTPRIGVFLWHDSANDTATLRGIRDGLRQSGLGPQWLERRAAGDDETARTALAELAAAHCDLVFALGTQAAMLAKAALPDVPIVFAAVSNPVAAGIVPSWGSAPGNVCGASNWIPPQNVLDVFQLAVPGLRRIGMLRSAATGVTSKAELATMQAHLASDPRQRLELVDAVAIDADDVERATGLLLQRDVDAIWIPIDPTIHDNLATVRRATAGLHLPLLTTAAPAMHGGAMVGVIPDYPLHGRRAAAMALQILRGERRPAEFAVDRMRGNVVAADVGAARALGIELPLSLLVLADELIDAESGR